MKNRTALGLALLGLTIAGGVLVLWYGGLRTGLSPAESNVGNPSAFQPGEATSRPLRVGLGTSSGIGDFGWSHGQNLGLLALQALRLEQVQTYCWEGVYEQDGCERALSGFASGGVDLAFVLGERNRDTVQAWAKQHPRTKVVQWYGVPQPPNLASCAILDYETAYLCGAAAALIPQAGRRLGVLAGYGTRVIRWVANSFTLGARSIRPDIEVDFRVLDTWYDPQAERSAVESLASKGVGAIYLIVIAPVPAVDAAERAGVFVLSHFGDQSEFAPTHWLTGTERVWHRLYDEVTGHVLDGSWEATAYQGGLQEGYVRLASFGSAVPPAVVGRIGEIRGAVLAGELPLYRGPLRDSRGDVRVPEGEVRGWSDLVEQDWMVEGIVESPSP